jgi:hypothetical protein
MHALHSPGMDEFGAAVRPAPALQIAQRIPAHRDLDCSSHTLRTKMNPCSFFQDIFNGFNFRLNSFMAGMAGVRQLLFVFLLSWFESLSNFVGCRQFAN